MPCSSKSHHARASQETESPYIKLIYEFDVSKINAIGLKKGFLFSDNLIYEITIFPIGNTSYDLNEKLYKRNDEGGEDLIYIKIDNSESVLSQRDVDSEKRPF